jgi:hypothetical protein
MSLEKLRQALASPLVCPNPIFILGAPRSGTTVLAESLATHSQLWASDESEILMDLFGRAHVDNAFDRVSTLRGGSWLRKEGVEKAELLGFLGLGMNALFTSRSRGKRWIDHTNLYTLMAETLAEMFPGALFLHALRDGRRAVHSTLHFANRFGEEERAAKIPCGRIAPWAADFREACKVWAQYVEAAISFASRYADRCLTVDNEELIADPRDVFSRVFDFIGVPFENTPIDFVRTNRINTSFPEIYKTTKSIPKLPPPWKEWNLDQRKAFVDVAGPTLVKSGQIVPQDLAQLAEDATNPYRRLLSAMVPEDGVVSVISKGDEELVKALGRKAQHFPQTEEGSYVGYHPADSAEAIMHLKALLEKDAQYILIPFTSLWWLEEYSDFAKYLDNNCRLVSRDVNHAIYALISQTRETGAKQPEALNQRRSGSL